MHPSQSYHIISVLIINCSITLLHCILRTVRFPSLQTLLFFSLYLFLSIAQIITDSYKSKTMPKFHNITTIHESVFGFDSIKVLRNKRHSSWFLLPCSVGEQKEQLQTQQSQLIKTHHFNSVSLNITISCFTSK